MTPFGLELNDLKLMMTYSAIILEVEGELYRAESPDDLVVCVEKRGEYGWEEWDHLSQDRWQVMMEKAGDDVYTKE